MDKVIIEVKCGTAYVVSIGLDIEVEIIDHDTQQRQIYYSQDSDTNIIAKK